MNLGQWLGKVVGQWFGPVEEQPQGFTSGTAQITIGATGTIYGGAVPSFVSGSASITMNASGTLVRNEEPSGAIMVREQIKWKAEQARREIERRKKAEEAARIAAERIAEAQRQAERAEREAQELIARLSRVDNDPAVSNDDAANLDGAIDSALRRISVKNPALIERVQNLQVSIQIADDAQSKAAFSDDDALALIMILAEID